SFAGQHCLNNLVQSNVFNAPDLAELAHELDAKERQMMLSQGADTPEALRFLAEDSGNVDASGNFSLQVLNEALKRRYLLQLESAGSEDVRDRLNTTGLNREEGFVCNRHSHWFAIRAIDGRYFNLNSTLKFPEHITTFALEATLAQIRADGYSVFVVRGGGKLPPPRREPDFGDRDNWYRSTELLKAKRGGGGSAGGNGAGPVTAAQDVWLTKGRRLDGKDRAGSGGGGSSGADGNGSGGGAAAEDDDLAFAIAMSL
ncbi:unnamed protein product, partial [Phaeothamnion confervicola]